MRYLELMNMTNLSPYINTEFIDIIRISLFFK